MKSKLVPLLALLMALLVNDAMAGPPGTLQLEQLSLRGGKLQLRVGVQSPEGPVAGDVLYLHGFADRLDNHGPLFDAWNRAGLRVISFDLPSHGETRGLLANLDLYSFEDLGELALAVERATRESAERPLVLSGWSTGGLLATRMIQSGQWNGAGSRHPRGLVLFAPGIAVRKLVGELGKVTARTLTRNPSAPHRGPISPASPFLKPVFASQLLANSLAACVGSLPAALPVLTLLGGDDEDRYVKTAEVRDWAVRQRTEHGVRMLGLQCDGAYHELDNEPADVGAQVRAAAAAFALKSATLKGGDTFSLPSGECRPF